MSKVLKAITLHRPWGYAITQIGKNIENRSWQCPLPPETYFAIHNGKKWDQAAAEWIELENTSELIPNPTQENDPPQAIIGIAKFKANLDMARGNIWFQGPIGWLLDDVLAIEPVACRGQRGLWTVPTDIANIVRINYRSTIAQSKPRPTITIGNEQCRKQQTALTLKASTDAI